MAREMMVSTRVYPFSSEGRERRGGEKGNEKYLKRREHRERRGREWKRGKEKGNEKFLKRRVRRGRRGGEWKRE
jgi:hypothetical protein